MVNPGVFHGLRKDFLAGEKVTYTDAIAGGYEKDAVADIQRRFFKRFLTLSQFGVDRPWDFFDI